MNGMPHHPLSKEFKGLICIVLGVILLLYTLNILQLWLNGFFIFLAIGMILYGFIETGLWFRIRSLINKSKK